MATLIIPKITILEPKKGKQGYCAIIEKNNTNIIKIKAKTVDGRNRGEVGQILRDGTIQLTNTKVHTFINKEIRSKIDFVLDMAYGKNRFNNCTLKSGLIKL